MKTAGNSKDYGKSIIIITILFINFCLVVPVWQSATNSQLKWRLAQSQQQIENQEEQKLVLSASIASQTTPEYLIEQSYVQNINFTQITSNVAVNR